MAAEQQSMFEQEARELAELAEEFEKVMEMPAERFYRVPNRQEKRAAERRSRKDQKQTFVNKPGRANG